MKITLIDADKTTLIDAERGQLIYDIIRTKTDDVFHAPCGGKGTCGKCRVTAEGSVNEPTDGERRLLSSDELGNGIRLACHCRVEGDATVRLSGAKRMDIQTSGLAIELAECDTVRVINVTLTKPTLENPLSVEENIRLAVGVPGLKIDRQTLNRVQGAKVCELWATVMGDTLVAVDFGEDAPGAYALAVDVGTSTLAAYLCDAASGAVIDITALENPQRAYGADVISRINYIVENADGLSELYCKITSAVNDMTDLLCQRTRVGRGRIYYAVITGNTIMQHILAELNPAGIANAPFIAASLFDNEINAGEINLGLNKNAKIYLPLCFASYVGGDIATGIISSNTDLTGENRVFLDVGTNGEIALKKDGRLYLCATAAGPAFEGAHIKKGTAGIDGAINMVKLTDGEITLETIGGLPPVGICGSGIIDAVAVMLEIGGIDETGRIVDEDELEGVFEKFAANLGECDGESVFFLDREADIYITQKDIREIQLAKSAINAGIMTLLHHTNTPLESIGSLIRAGGFGAHMNPSSACKIGLIPPELESKIVVGGNTAGMGAVACALSSKARERVSALKGISEYIELSGNPYFMDLYVDKMMF